jgi:hypothetical protein
VQKWRVSLFKTPQIVLFSKDVSRATEFYKGMGFEETGLSHRISRRWRATLRALPDLPRWRRPLKPMTMSPRAASILDP